MDGVNQGPAPEPSAAREHAWGLRVGWGELWLIRGRAEALEGYVHSPAGPLWAAGVWLVGVGQSLGQ